MRYSLIAAAALTACLAPAAAAQPDPEQIVQQVVDRLVLNHGGAEDYTLVLAYDDVRVPVYVYEQADGEWTSATPPDRPLGEFMSAAVLWPEVMVVNQPVGDGTGEGGNPLEDAVYGGTELVDGRRAHVVRVRFTEAAREMMPDSIALYADTETSQILRMAASMEVPGMAASVTGGRPVMHMLLEYSDYRAHGGLTVPGRIRMDIRMEMNMTDKERQSMREDIGRALAAMEQEQTPADDEAREMLKMVRVFAGLVLDGRMELPMTVEEVRMNSGRPAWLTRRKGP